MGALLVLLSLSLSLTATCTTDAGEVPWFRRALVGLEVGPTGAQFGGDARDTAYASRFDGRQIVRASKASGAEYLVIWARDGDWAYYDSKLQPKCPGLGDRDVLREAVEEGRRLNLPILAYCVQQYPAQTLREHPDWRMVSADGKPIEGRVCYRSGYLGYMKQMLSEQLAYGIAGFHLDMVDQGFGPPYGCWCTSCQSAFQARYGKAMPQGVTWDEGWDRMLEFRYESSDTFERELTRHIRSENPSASVDFNYHGNPPFSWEVGQLPVRHAVHGDFMTGETGVWGFSALTVGLNAEFYRAATPGQPFQVAMQRGVRMYHDQTTRPLQDLRWELFNLLAHGAFVTLVDKTGFDGWLDPVAYERFGDLFREVAAKREHFGQQPLREVGILYGARTRDWMGRDKPAAHVLAFQGAHKAMVYAHLPWGVLHEENLSLDTLRQYPVVLLPNVAILPERLRPLLRRYVEEGGNLLLTGLTGSLDLWGQPGGDLTLGELAGARLVRPLDSTDNWVRFPAGSEVVDGIELAPGGRTDWPFLVRGPALILEPTTATPVGELLKPHRTTLHQQGRYNADWPLSADAPVGPAALLHQVGKGRVLTLAASPDWATASDHHTVEARRLLVQAVRLLHPTPRVRITAPITVETVVTDDPAHRTLRIHLLGYQSPPQTTPAKDRPYVLPVPLEDRPLFRVAVDVDRDIRSARAVSRGTRLRRSGRHVDATVEDIHDVLLLRY